MYVVRYSQYVFYHLTNLKFLTHETMTKQTNHNQTSNPIQQDTVGDVGDKPRDNTGSVVGDEGVSGAPSTCIVAVEAGSNTDDTSDPLEGVKGIKSDPLDWNGDTLAVVSPRPQPPIKSPTYLDFEQQIKNLNKAVALSNRRLKQKEKKVDQLLKTVSNRDEQYTKLEVKLKSKLASKDVQIANWKNRLERAKESKAAIREAVLAECTAMIERQKAKAAAAIEQLGSLRKQCKKSNEHVENLEAQLDAKLQRLSTVESSNTRFVTSNGGENIVSFSKVTGNRNSVNLSG